MSDALPREIRCVLIPAGSLRLLLPNSLIAEVIAQPPVEPLHGAPAWVFGSISWRGQQVPLVSFTQLVGAGDRDATLSIRVAVLRTLGGDPRLPFVALITQGFPRLTTLNPDLIIPVDDGKVLPPGERARALVGDDVAVIPDLEWIESELLEKLGGGTSPTAVESPD
ncbi:MAG: chemotaxis protein CheW [Rhodanobacter sp.]